MANIYMSIDDILAGNYSQVTNVIQIKNANKAYIVTAKRSEWSSKYYIYTQSGSDLLAPVWYGTCDNNGEAYFLPFQHTQTRNGNKPYIEFRVKGVGLNREYELAYMLKSINHNIEIYSINGWYPSYISVSV